MPSADVTRHRPRLVRGPVTIGEPSAPLEFRLAVAEPYRPDTIADGGEAFGLTVRAASVRGLAKRFSGGPRQDDLCLGRHQATGTIVIAVADGVSGAARSDMGAALAVRYAVAALTRQLDGAAGDSDALAAGDPRGGAADVDWGEVFRQAAWALLEEHRRFVADPSAAADQAAGQLATTLVVAAVDRRRVRVAAVGDSTAFVLAGGRFLALVPEPAREDGLVGGEVQALPRAVHAVRSGEAPLGSQEVVLVCTDGLSMPLAGGGGEVGRLFARELRHPPDPVDFARLLDFSRATYDDDRTLVAVWGAGGGD